MICLFALLARFDLILGLFSAVQETIGLIAGLDDVAVMRQGVVLFLLVEADNSGTVWPINLELFAKTISRNNFIQCYESLSPIRR